MSLVYASRHTWPVNRDSHERGRLPRLRVRDESVGQPSRGLPAEPHAKECRRDRRLVRQVGIEPGGGLRQLRISASVVD